MIDSPLFDSCPESSGVSVSVLVAAPLPRAFDYRVPDGMAGVDGGISPLASGTVVVVPLGRREVVGVVWGPGSDDVAPGRLKDIVAVLDLPRLTRSFRAFIDWVARYVMAPPGSVLRLAIGSPALMDPPRPITLYALPEESPSPDGEASDVGGVRLTAARRRVLTAAAGLPPLTASDLAAEAGVGAGVIKSLADHGLLQRLVRTPQSAVEGPPTDLPPGPELGPDQQACADALVEAVRRRPDPASADNAGAEDEAGFQPFVLDGVTGSGKTEVYFEAIAEAVRQGRQALVLLPEIALSTQWLERFRHRFGFDPRAWHSEVTSARRRETWRAAAAGTASVVVGARSALFLPLPKLGLIVVDEEHDGAFKQEDGVVYNARDMAVVRAKMVGCPVVLASATPSLETLGNARAGRYRHLVLPDRHGQAVLPHVETVDLRRDRPPRGRFIAPGVVDAIRETMAREEQAMIFLNRRGYAPLTLCSACGHRLECPNCTAWLVEHRLSGRLMCHHCGHSSRLPPKCESCGAEESFVPCGPGVERIAEEVADLFPDARSIIMASDVIHTAAQAADMIARVQSRDVDLVIGTQLVAKGHNFPLLSLVVVVDSDIGFEGGDFRAFERTYQLLSQVGGRSGRAETSGTVLLQTRAPEHPVIAALTSGDRDGFRDDLLEERRRHGLPPFTRMAAVIVSGPDAATADRVARDLGRTAPAGDPAVSVVGPAPAPLALLRGRHRRRLLMTADRRVPIQQVLNDWIGKVSVPASVKVTVDVDPYSFM